MPLGEKEAMMWWDKPVIPILGDVKVFGSGIQGHPQLLLVSKRQSKQRPSKLFLGGWECQEICLRLPPECMCHHCPAPPNLYKD